MHFMKKLLICIVLFITVSPLIGLGKRFKTIDIQHGLSNNTVKCITQDSNGFMWFGTFDGLCRYDGVSFTVFKNDENDPFSLVNNSITALFAVDSGLWVGTADGLDFLSFIDYNFYDAKIVYEDGNREPLRRYVTEIVTFHESVMALVDGKLLIKGEGYTFNPYNIVALNSSISMIKLYKDELLLVFSDEGIHLVNPQSRFIIKELLFEQSSVAQAYYSKKRNSIYVGYGMGKASRVFAEIAGQFEEINKLKVPQGVKAITEFGEEVVFGTDGEGLVFLSKNGLEVNVPQNSNISSDAIFSLFTDSENNLWAGTYRGGINFYNEANDWFTTYSMENKSINHNTVTSVYEYAKNKLYIGTDGGGLNLYNKETGIASFYTTENSAINGNNILSLAGDGNYLWLAIYNKGLSRFDIKQETFKFYDLKNLNINNVDLASIWVIKDDELGNIWIGSNKGLYCFNKKTEQIVYSQTAISGVSQIALSKGDSSLWVSSSAGGLYKLDSSGKILLHIFANEKEGSIKNNIVREVFVDSDDEVWFSTEYTGLHKVEQSGKHLKHYGKDHGLENFSIVSIVEDDNKNLWIGTYYGLFKFNKEKEIFIRFGEADHIPSAQFNYNACYKSDDKIYFGTSKGIIQFYPEKVKYNDSFKKVIFTNFKLLNDEGVEGKYRICPSRLSLPFNKNFFTISFSSPEFISADKIVFSCFMEGFEKNWQNIGYERKISYTNVPPGEYTFNVRSTNHNGEWGEKITSLPITIIPPWWRRTWAKAIFTLVALILFASILFIYNHEMKMKHLVELKEVEKESAKSVNEEKLRFFANISHELRTPIFLLTAPIEELISTKSKYVQIPKAHLLDMHKNALRLKKLINRIIDFRKLEAGKLKLELSNKNAVQFCKELVADHEILCEQKGILLIFYPSKLDIQLTFDPEKLESIISNLITNAFKFTPENGKIILKIDELQDAVVFQVEDSGIGIEKEALDLIFERFYQANGSKEHTGDGIGLSFVKKLVELHGGEISVKSEVGKGSTFTFTISKMLAHDKAETIISIDENIDIENNNIHSENKVEIVQNPLSVNSILVIDDDKDVLETLERILANDFKVFKAFNGLEGLSIARQTMPDIIICDIMMPRMNGIEFLTLAKKDETLKAIPVIMLTAKITEEDMLNAFDCGAAAYLTKPVSLQFLKRRINHLLSNSKSTDLSQIFIGKNGNFTKEEKKFILKCKKIIDDNMSNLDFNVKYFSENLGMSHSSVYKKIKSLTGKTIVNFVNTYRIYNAVKLFNEGDANISQVAAKCGFNDIKNFRICFKERMGVTPKQYING